MEFVDGKVENFDAIILATGYKSNVPSWLKVKMNLINNRPFFFFFGNKGIINCIFFIY